MWKRMSKTRKSLVVVAGVFMLVFVIGIISSATGGDSPAGDEPDDASNTDQRATQVPSAAHESVPQVTGEIADIIVAEMKSRSNVRDAAVGQDGKTISLALVVSFAATDEFAKKEGDNFVRLVKSLSPDSPPGKEVGTGIYDYLITVAHPDGPVIERGAKVSFSPKITW